jgi:hypothetical protein
LTAFRDRPFLHGVLFGLGMPLLALLVPALVGDLRAWFVEGAVYGMMPLFAILGIPSFVLTKRLKREYVARGQRSLHLTHGMLLGGWIVGVLLMWASTPGGAALARLASALSGGAMLVAFWPWAGSIIAHYEPRMQSGTGEQTQDLSVRPR